MPGGLAPRIPAFHPGCPGSILGQGTKLLLQATIHCCLSEISITFFVDENEFVLRISVDRIHRFESERASTFGMTISSILPRSVLVL